MEALAVPILRDVSRGLGAEEARWLVDLYYSMQDYRIQTQGQIRSIAQERDEGSFLVGDWLLERFDGMEKEVNRALAVYAAEHVPGRWAMCSPPESEVLVQGGRGRRGRAGATVPISALGPDSRVVAFDRRRARLTDPVPVSVGATPFSGDLLRVVTDAGETRVTPAHKWLVRLEAPQEACVVYLMQRGDRYRVGVVQAIKTEPNRHNGRFALRGRARHERAKRAWILRYFPNRREACIYEAFIAAQYGLPTTVFRAINNGNGGFWGEREIDRLFEMFDPDEQELRASRCLLDHGLSPSEPMLFDVGHGTKETVASIVCHAINLVPGMMQIPVPLARGGIEWHDLLDVRREHYDGPVYSLDVPGHHAYVQDGLATRNSITGIGPVIAAGLLAHIDIEKAPTVGHIWRFAGLDPTVTWGRGEKRPWNAKLKRLCWIIGDSFVKQKSRESDIYGKVYAARKVQEVERNEAGLFAEQAARALEERKIKDKDLRATYEAGRLPAGRLDLRARRYAVKLFLVHFHHVMYEDHFGEPPPKPYILTNPAVDPTGKDHVHFIGPPNWPL